MVGPFVTMIYKMLVGDLLRFFTIYLIFLIGFSQVSQTSYTILYSQAMYILYPQVMYILYSQAIYILYSQAMYILYSQAMYILYSQAMYIVHINFEPTETYQDTPFSSPTEALMGMFYMSMGESPLINQ